MTLSDEFQREAIGFVDHAELHERYPIPDPWPVHETMEAKGVKP